MSRIGIALLVGVLASPAFATLRTVDGALGQTIASGILAMQPGDTLQIRGAHDGFDGVYREQITLATGEPVGTPGIALACSQTAPCTIRGDPRDPAPQVRGARRYGPNWTADGSGVFSRVSEATPVYDPAHNRDAWDPAGMYEVLDDGRLVALQYSGDGVVVPPLGSWSYDPPTHRIRVAPFRGAQSIVEVPFFLRGLLWRNPTRWVTIEHLAFQMTRGSGIQTYGPSIPGLVFRDLRIWGVPDYGWHAINGALAPIVEDLDIQMVARGSSWDATGGSNSSGGFGLRVFLSPGAIFRRVHIAHLGSAGVSERNMPPVSGEWLDPPWNSRVTNAIGRFGFCFNLKQVNGDDTAGLGSGAIIEDFRCEDYATSGIGLDYASNVRVSNVVMQRGQACIGVRDFTPTANISTSHNNLYENIRCEDMHPAGTPVCAVNTQINGRDPLVTYRNTTFVNPPPVALRFCPASGTGLVIDGVTVVPGSSTSSTSAPPPPTTPPSTAPPTTSTTPTSSSSTTSRPSTSTTSTSTSRPTTSTVSPTTSSTTTLPAPCRTAARGERCENAACVVGTICRSKGGQSRCVLP